MKVTCLPPHPIPFSCFDLEPQNPRNISPADAFTQSVKPVHAGVGVGSLQQ